MANIKISQLPAASTITAASDVLPIVHASVTEKATPNQIVNKVLEAPGAIGGTTPSTGAFSSVTTAGLTTTGTVSLNSYITVNNTAAFLLNPRIWDSSQTHWYRMTPSELSLDVYTTLPALTGNDVFVFQAHTQTLTNKTISGANNTLSNIGNASLSNSSITINDTVVSLGGSITIGSGISYPSAGIPVSTGTAWGTSKTNPDGDLVGTTEIQTLTNKTLSAAILTNSPRIASPGIYAQNGVNLYGISAGNITSDVSCFLPNLTTSDTFVFALAAQTLTSKTLTSPTINSATINTSTITGGSISGITDLAVADGGTGASSAAAARVNLLPSYTSNASKVLALNSGGTDVEWIAMTGGGMTYPGAGVAISTGTAWSTSKTAPSGDFVGTSDTQTLSAKTLTSPTINGGTATNLTSLSVTSSVTFPFFNIDATAVWLRNPRIYDNSQNNWYRITPSELSTDVYVTLPALPGNDTFVFASFAQTLTNKTLTSPTINGGTITGITDLAIADGGTNASNATDAIWNLTNGLTGRAASRVLAVNSANTGLEWITAGGAGMVYPAAGIPLSTGSAWSTSLVAPSGDLVGTNGSQTLTNKIISGSNNTLSNIANASLTNSAITINGTSVSLGGSISTGWTTSGVNLNTTLNPSVNATAYAWNSGMNHVSVQGASLYAFNSGSGGGAIGYAKNAYYDASGNWIYKNTGVVSLYFQGVTGDHVFSSAISGTAGSTVTLQTLLQIKATGQLRFQPLASNPSSPTSGDLYYNSSSQNFQFYNGSAWGALGGGSSSGMYVTVAGFTTAEINAAIASAGFGGTIFLPAGTYSITSTINIQDRNVIGAGFNTILQGVSASLGAGNPMFVLSGIVTIKSLRAQFDVKPATATAGQYVIFRTGNGSNPLQRYSNIDSVWTYYCGTAFWNPTGPGSVFSTTFSNLRVEFFTYRGFDFNGTDRTGNIYSNIYLAAGIPFTQSNTSQTISTGSKTFTTTLAPNTTDFSVGQIVTVAQQTNALNAMYGAVTSKTTDTITINVTSVIGSGSSAAWNLTARNTCNAIFALSGIESECVISQVNPEHSFFTQAAVIFDGVNALSANAIHLEQVTPTANNLPFIYTNASSGVINALTFLGNWYPQYLMPTTTGNSIFQCNSAYNTYGGTNNTLTANYFDIGEFYIANSSETTAWTMFSRGTDNGPMYIEVGGYQYTGSNNNYYANFPTSGNLTFISSGVNSYSTQTRRTFNGTTNLRDDTLTTINTGATSTFARPTNGSIQQYFVGTTASGQLVITSGGTPALFSGSDYRLKENIQPLTGSVEQFKSIQPCSFDIIGSDTTQYGFVAHELQNVWPDAVIGEKDAVDEDGNPIYQQVAQTKLIPIMAQAIKELIEKVEALESANNG